MQPRQIFGFGNDVEKRCKGSRNCDQRIRRNKIGGPQDPNEIPSPDLAADSTKNTRTIGTR